MTDVALVGITLALVTALVHVAYLYWLPIVLGGLPLGWGRDIIWMAPLSYLLFFAVLGAALFAAAVLRRGLDFALIVGGFTFLAALAILLLFSRIHPYASLALALGVGVQHARVARAAPQRWRLILRRSGVALGIFFLVAGLTSRSWRTWKERRALAAVPEVRVSPPNVLLIILDTVRASSLSLYGYERPTTPALERVADESFVFDRAISTASWTLPSHGSIFTGYYGGELSGRHRTPLDAATPTLAEYFSRRGYATGGFIANYVFTSHETGLSRGFMTYEDVPVSAKQIVWSSSLAQTTLVRELVWSRSPEEALSALRNFDLRLPAALAADPKDAAEVTDEFLQWERGLGDRPFFAFLNYFDAHEPYLPPPAFRTRFAPAPTLRDRYDGGIAYIDQELDRLFEELRARRILDRTLVIITADHGEQWGEWGRYDHGNSVYLPSVHVPLLMRLPDVVPAGRSDVPVSLRDLATSIAALTDTSDVSAFPGTSLARAWTDSGPAPSRVLAAVLGERRPSDPPAEGHLFTVIHDGWQYIRSTDGTEELFDLRTVGTDPRNLVSDPESDVPLRELRASADLMFGDPDAHVALAKDPH